MFPASNQGVGSNVGFPDVCMTPAAPSPVPIPYPNVGMNSMSMPFAPNVLISAMPAHNMAAKPLMTNGDNAGVAHPLCMQPGGCIMGNPTVHINGLPSEHLMTPSYGNNFNAPVGAKLIPSITNVLISWATGGMCGMAADLHDVRRPGREPAVRFAMLGDRIGLLRVARFAFPVSTQARSAIARMAGIRSLIVDLRGNPGGAVGAARRFAGLFLPSGAAFAGLGGTLQRCPSPGSSFRGRLLVWIDERTASAAELVARALKVHGRALVAGRRSLGKGIAEAVRADRTRVSLRTTGPDGVPLDDAVVPDRPCESLGSAVRLAADLRL